MLTGSVTYCQTDSVGYVYHEPLFDFSYDKTTFKLANEQLNNKNKFLRGSVLTGYREGLQPTSSGMLNFEAHTDSITGIRKITMVNLSIEEMLIHSREWYPKNKVVLEVKDPSRYRYDSKYGSKENWIRKNTYCYEFIMPEGTMQIGVPNTLMGLQFEEDLQHLFGVKVFREKRMYKLQNKAVLEEQEVLVIKETK